MERYVLIPVLTFLAFVPQVEKTAETNAAPQIVLASEQVGQPKPVEQDEYAKAYEAAQLSGKLCVYIGTSRCPYCPGAKAAFRDASSQCNGACVELDADNKAHQKYIRDIQREHGKGSGIPQVVVYQKFGDEWQWKVVVGNKPTEIKAAMTNLQAMDKVVKCECSNCTRSCRYGGNCACR